MKDKSKIVIIVGKSGVIEDVYFNVRDNDYFIENVSYTVVDYSELDANIPEEQEIEELLISNDYVQGNFKFFTDVVNGIPN